jgi:hypothetical protein
MANTLPELRLIRSRTAFAAKRFPGEKLSVSRLTGDRIHGSRFRTHKAFNKPKDSGRKVGQEVQVMKNGSADSKTIANVYA